jgi:hypothetical protein
MSICLKRRVIIAVPQADSHLVITDGRQELLHLTILGGRHSCPLRRLCHAGRGIPELRPRPDAYPAANQSATDVVMRGA